MQHHPPPSHIGISNHVHDQFHLMEPGSCMSFYAISCSNRHAINNNIEAGADHIVDDSGGDIIDHHHHSPPPVIDSSEASPRSFSADHHHDFITLLHGSDPVKEEINRLENEVREKNREMAETQAEIKALKLAERSREKALEELSDELARVDDRLERAELLLDNKNLELKRVNDEKRAAQAAQHAAEATLRRVQAAQKDEDMPPIEAILAPLDAEIKLTRQEVARLQEDNRALDRLTKAKEAALLEAERTVQIATAKASMVDDLQNKNQELARHIDFCQEENKLLDKLHRQKITEVEKLSMTVTELEEELLSSGNAANAARDFQRQLQQVQEEKKALERELARVKITANRVAVVVANGWKDSNDKVMPVRQWLEERRFLQGEMVQLREKLASMERTAKTEAILKEKVQLRLKVLEENFLNAFPSNAFHGAATPSRPPPARAHLLSLNIAGGSSYKSVNFCNTTNTATLAAGRSINSTVNRHHDGRKLLGRCNSARALLQRNVRSISKSFNAGSTVEISSKSGLLNQQQQMMSKISPAPDHCDTNCMGNTSSSHVKVESTAICTGSDVQVLAPSKLSADVTGDYVSGQLYDLLQKEVILLRKACYEKDRGLSDKDNAIEMLEKKVSGLNRAMELESKRMRREVAAMEKEVAALRSSCAANHNNNSTITNQDASCGNNNVESSSKGASNKNANGALRFR